jgi:phage terminase small subunit
MVVQRGRKSAESLATLRVVPPEPSAPGRPAAPNHLSPAMKDWWDAVTADYDLDRHHLRLLEAACGAWDRMVQARIALAEHGLTYESQGGPRARPEVAIERDSRLSFARLLRELDLDVAPEPPRPPSLRSNRR